MSEYIFTIIAVSVAVGFFLALTPERGGIDKYVRMIGILVILCAMVSPIGKFFQNLDGDFLDNLRDELISQKQESENYDEIFREYLENFSLNDIKSTIADMLNKEFNIPENEIQINISTDIVEGTPRIKNVQILLSGNSIFQNPYKIEEFVKNNLKCDCQVLIKSRKG